MRLSRGVKRARRAGWTSAGVAAVLAAVMMTTASAARAQYAPTTGYQQGYQQGYQTGYQPGYQPGYQMQPYQATAPGQQPVTQQQFEQVLQTLKQQQQNQQNQQTQQQSSTAAPTPPADLGDPNDPDSAAYKANKLADHAVQQRDENATLTQQGVAGQAGLDRQNPPPDMGQLQDVNKYQSGAGNDLIDNPVNADASLDMRRQAQKEAALSYGARGGLAKRNFEIMQQMHGFGPALDHVFNFRALLIRAPSGLLIEPPIINESDKALVIADNGNEAAVADKVYDINQKARIVSAPRDWRQYLIQSWSTVPPPPRVLWPKNPKEQAMWDIWVREGWQAGVEQANQIFAANVNRLVADYKGMVRYRMLLAQNMISAPYAMQEDRGVTGGPNQMRIGDSAIRITDPSQFLKKANLWQPADQ